MNDTVRKNFASLIPSLPEWFTSKMLAEKARRTRNHVQHQLSLFVTAGHIEMHPERLVKGSSWEYQYRAKPTLFDIPKKEKPVAPEWIPFKVPAAKTDCWPGTQEKIAVMRERVERHESPFHPGDNNNRGESPCHPNDAGFLQGSERKRA